MRSPSLVLVCSLFFTLGAFPLVAQSSAPNPRMAGAASAYLRSHAQHAIEWYPWGEEALAKAKAEKKLIFVSLGYSTCHWCHVMARESFQDEQVAKVLNQSFVSIKVDREERPDLDRRFITFLEHTQGSAGWPANIWLTPEGEPFFGSTYLPKDDELGSPGFLTLLGRMADLWVQNSEAIFQQAKLVGAAPARETSVASSPSDPSSTLVPRWLEAVRQTYDPVNGGFESGPKFPNALLLRALLQTPPDGREPSASAMALHTLRQLARSSLHDVLGGGFHRYTVDGEWRLPHFEKMLTDQALLAMAYTEAWCVTGEPEFEATVRSVLSGLEGFRLPKGGFASAIDAESVDSEGRKSEGAYYVWSWEELSSIYNSDTLPSLAASFGLKPGGNLPAGGAGALTSSNLLDPANDRPWHEFLHNERADDLDVLRSRRLQRQAPWRDETLHAGYNALVVSAWARAGLRFQEPKWITEASSLGEFLRTQHWDRETRRLRRIPRQAGGSSLAFADDYANTVAAALDLYEATHSPTWLIWAIELQHVQDALFRVPSNGGYANEAEGPGSSMTRRVDFVDRAEASPNSTAALNLLRLAALTGDATWEKSARQLFAAARADLEDLPVAHPLLIVAHAMTTRPSFTVLITGDLEDAQAKQLTHKASLSPAWSTSTLRVAPATWATLAALHPELIDLLPEGAGTTAAVVCTERRCLAPVREPADLARLLQLPSY